jgi:hypothetical protein
MRNHELERQMANDTWNDYNRRPWPTQKPDPAGSCGYCGPDVEPEPEEESENE